MLNVGIALVVKNEAHDIISWLAWHQSLNFNTFFIYDDCSNDGTFELIDALTTKYDIRLQSIDIPHIKYYYFRQEEVYRRVIEENKESFDWLLFIDSDEYLFLDHHENVQDFLSGFTDFDAVAINWCQYGSNGYILSPKISPLSAFTAHAAPSYEMCKHVKSFVRPKRIGKNWLNVHAFDVDPAKYCLPSMQTFDWGIIPGITALQPDWRSARILHYQCRSMQQFIERTKRRTDINTTYKTWLELNTNDLCTTLNKRRLDALEYNKNRFIDVIINDTKNNYLPDMKSDDEVKCFFLKSTHGNRIMCSYSGDVAHNRASRENDIPLLVAKRPQEDKILCFLDSDDVRSINWNNELNTGTILLFEIERSSTQAPATLRHLPTGKYLRAIPEHHGGLVGIDGDDPKEWEKFDLLDVTDQPVTQRTRMLLEIWAQDSLFKRAKLIKEAADPSIQNIYIDLLNAINYNEIEREGNLISSQKHLKNSRHHV